MDQYLSAVVIAIITGIFSVITLIIQKRQDKVIKKIDEQTLFIEKEKGLKQKLTEKEKEREAIIHEIMLLILDTNVSIMKSTQIGNSDVLLTSEVFEECKDLESKFEEVSNSIKEISKEYEIVLNMTSEFQKELSKKKK